MKKELTVIAILSLYFILTACGNSSDNVAANIETTDVSEENLIYPISIESTLYDYATTIPNIAYTTPSEENGLTGNAYCVSGTVVETVSSEASSYGSRYFVVKNENGKVYFLDFVDSSLADDTTSEEKELFQTMYGSGYDDTFPQENEIITAYGLYFGYSNVLNAPVFYFGLNENVQELLLSDAKTTAEVDVKESSDSLEQTFALSSDDIAQIIYGEKVDSFSKQTDEYIVDVFPNKDYFVFCVTLEGENYPFLVYTYDQAQAGTANSAEALIQPFIDTLTENKNLKTSSYNVSDSSRKIISCAWVNDSAAKNFPFTMQLSPDTDYFLYADIEEYKLACKEGRYDDILSDVQTYIDNANPPSYDNAYILQSILLPIVEDWEYIEVQYDPVENYAKFFYTDTNSINANVHFVPYASTNEKKIRLLIGFYDSDWLFFDRITISSNENIRISASDDGKIEDVMNGGKIYEAYDISLDDDDLEELLSSEEHIIRFESKNGTYKDYEMSDKEYKALSSISKFQDVRNILSDLLFHFQNNFWMGP